MLGTQSATTSQTGGMRKAPKRGHIEQSLVFIDRINPPILGGAPNPMAPEPDPNPMGN